jgi:hypothetical protein
MPVYYRSPELVITDEVFEIAGRLPMRFRMERLSNAHVVESDPHPARFATKCAALGGPALALLTWPLMHGWEHAAALFLVMAPAAVAGACHRLTPPTRELRAVYGHSPVVLFRSADPINFGKVQRALMRALELHAGR